MPGLAVVSQINIMKKDAKKAPVDDLLLKEFSSMCYKTELELLLKDLEHIEDQVRKSRLRVIETIEKVDEYIRLHNE